ncbi:MAG: amidase [Chloroflexi bacterium]|nr:MAG: amidase [Chloroflexota bacterium]
MPVQSTTKIAALLNALRKDEIDLLDYLKQVQLHFESIEPSLMAFVEELDRFERLTQDAKQLEERYPNPDSRPPLYGLPIGIKDIFHVDGFETHAGSQLPTEALAGAEADSVTKLKEAGALIFGKTITTEFAYFAPGPTRNPHNPEHTPGGSSSGSAAAVGAGLCTVALGTQTIGSVNRPAAFCGVYGFKPSYNRISKESVIPLSISLDHVGILASDLPGAALVAGVLCKDWQEVEASESLTLGIPVGPYLEKASGEGRQHFEDSVAKLDNAGYATVEVETMPNFDEIVERHNLIVAAEAAHTHAEWFSKYEDKYHQRTADLIRKGQQVDTGELEAATKSRLELRRDLTETMEQHGIDYWITPSAPGPAPKGLDSTGDPIMNLPWTQSGLPSLTLPSGLNAEGLPLALQVIGRWYADEAVFADSIQINAALK